MQKQNVEPLFTIENNILKGRVMLYNENNRYTCTGKLLYDCLTSKPDLVGQVDAITGIEDTFGEMADRAIKCALWLREHGVRRGDIVVVSSHNHRDTIIPCVATLFLGGIFCAWNSDVNVQLARYFIKLIGPKAIFTNENSVDCALKAVELENFRTEVVTFGDHPTATLFSDVLRGHKKSAVDDFRCEEVDDPEQTAAIFFSSGTTGPPKGVQISHRGILHELLGLVEGFHLKKNVVLWYSTLSWITGGMLSLKSITSFSKRIIAPDFNEKITCEIIEKYKVTYLMLGTSMTHRLALFNGLKDYDLSSLKLLTCGGAPLNSDTQVFLKKHLPHTWVMQIYGMTESGSLIAYQLPESTNGSCGFVRANCKVKIVDSETGQALGPNCHGELCSKSLTMMTGYYKDPEATNQIIDQDGWLHSGDLAYYNENGELFIIDRIKELIKYKGHQISPTEIEDLLQSHPAVLEAAVVGVPHPTDDEHPVAFVRKVPDKEVSAEELIKLVEGNMMDSHKLRGGVKFLANIPRTSSGKIARKELKTIAKTLAVH